MDVGDATSAQNKDKVLLFNTQESSYRNNNKKVLI